MRKLGITFIVVFGFGFTGIAQEYDDLYFNSSDRKKAKQERIEELKAELEAPKHYTSPSYYGDNYSQSDVDPDLIEQYKQQDEEKRLQYLSPYNSLNNQVNSNFGETPLDFQYNGQYDQEDFYYQDEYQGNPTIINNYYGGNVNPGWNNGFGYGGWGNGWGVGIGMGWGMGWNSWGFYDPFWNPWYDPWFGMGGWGYGIYRPWGGWGWNSPWRYGGFYDYGWCYIAPNTPSKQPRDINRGPRMDRGGNLATSNGQNRPLRGMAQNTTGRTQSDYIQQARGDGGSSTRPYSSGGVTNYTNRNTPGTQSATRPSMDRNGINSTQNSTQTRNYQIRPSRNAGTPQYQNRNQNQYYQQRPGNTVYQNRSNSVPSAGTYNRMNQQRQQSGQSYQMPNTQRANRTNPNVNQGQQNIQRNQSGGQRSHTPSVNRSSNQSSGGNRSGGSTGSLGGSSGGSSGGGSRGGGGRGGN